MNKYMKTGYYDGAITEGQDLYNTLKGDKGDTFVLSGFTLISDTQVTVQINAYSTVTAMTQGIQYIVNISPGPVAIDRLVFSAACNIELNYFWKLGVGGIG